METVTSSPYFLTDRESADLIQTAFPGLAGCHTAVQGYGAGVSNGTAARRGKEDLGNGYGAAA